VSVTLDTNILIYASNEAEPLHERARVLVERLANGPELIYLFWPTIMGYLRIMTHPAILPHPRNWHDAATNIGPVSYTHLTLPTKA